MAPACRLCYSRKTELLHRGDRGFHHREFHRCRMCGLVFVPDRYLLTPEEERARYELHENHPDNAGYVAFLSTLLGAMLPRLEPGAEGLDYGCGDTAVLMGLFEARGYRMSGYDLYFRPDEAALGREYDFIVCSETAEHFRDAGAEFGRLDGTLRPGGTLGVMTAMPERWDDFADWHYPRDNTHICFYNAGVMRWIAARFGWTVELPDANVAIFTKPEAR